MNVHQQDPIHIYYKASHFSDGMGAHIHHLYEMIFVEEGVAEFEIGDKVVHVRRNQIIFISSLERHSLRILQYPYKRTVITMTSGFALFNIKEPALVAILSHRPADFPYVFSLSDDLSKKIKRLMTDLISEYELKDYFWLSRSAAIVSGMLIDIYRYNPHYFDEVARKQGTPVILEIQKYISEHFQEEISLEYLAEKFFFSTSYISRKFKSITGYNLKHYIILNRLSYAKEQLRYTGKSISLIAEECGYSTLNQFTRIFTQYESKAPSAYRQEFHQDPAGAESDW